MSIEAARAYPTTPALAQGAGMTIEDAPVLARALAAARDLRSANAVAAALADYERQDSEFNKTRRRGPNTNLGGNNR